MKKITLQPGLLALSVAVPLCVGVLSSVISGDMMKEYFFMNKPPLSPPGWLFPIVWTVLYAMMGVAVYLVLTSGADKGLINKALAFFGIQLILNFLWSILFFRYSLFLWALVELIIMLAMIAVATVFFFRASVPAGAMMIPYILWTTFAVYLNYAVYKLSITPMPIHK